MKKGTRVLLAVALTLLASAAVPAEAQEPGVTWDHRPTIVLGEGSRLDIRGRFQSDYLVRDESDPDLSSLSFEDRLSVPRKRVAVDGVLFDRVAFEVEGEIDDVQPWRDVYADVKVNRALHVRAGRFKVPFSLEQLARGTDLDFIARAAAVSDLAPSRDTGVMFHGRLAAKAIKYEGGVFEVDAATRLWRAGATRTYAGRMTFAPLHDGKWRGSDALEFSAALLRSDLPEGRSSLNGHLVMGDTFFHRMFVNGIRTRMGASVAWNATRVSVQGEWIRALDSRQHQAIDGGNLSDLVSTGGYAAGVWHLMTSNGRRWGHAPLRGIDLTGRFDRLAYGSTATSDDAFLNPRADHVAPIGKDTWTAGVNWYVNRWTKIQANAVREQLVDPLALLPLSTAPLWSTVVRFQVAM